MMDELKDVKKFLNPTEVLLVVDAMTGQEAAGTLFVFYIFQEDFETKWIRFKTLSVLVIY